MSDQKKLCTVTGTFAFKGDNVIELVQELAEWLTKKQQDNSIEITKFRTVVTLNDRVNYGSYSS